MLKAFHLAFLFSLLFQVVQAQQTTRVIENGEEKVLQFNTEATLTLPKDLLSYYRDRGFLEVVISQSASSTPIVNTGPVYHIHLVEYDEVPNSIKALHQQSYNRFRVEETLQQTIEDYKKEGYVEAEVIVRKAEVDTVNKQLKLDIAIDRGEQVQVKELFIVGNTIQSDAYLRKISRVSDQGNLDIAAVKEARENLLNSGLFESVGEWEWVKDESGAFSVLLPVVELNRNEVEGLIGYVPNADGAGQLVGDFKGTAWNVFTEGNSVDLVYQRVRPEVSRLQLASHQYWVGQLPLELGLEFAFFQNDSTYQQRSMDVSLGYMMTSTLSIQSSLYHKVVNVNDEAPSVNEEDSKASGLELGFLFNSVVNNEVPIAGNRLALSLGRYARSSKSDDNNILRYNYLEGLVDNYTQLSKQQVLAMRIRGFSLLGDEFRDTDYQRIGGANSIRGYTEEQFLASQYIWGDVELRCITSRQQSYFFLFAAGGYFEKKNASNTIQKDLYSGGLGFDLATRLGRLKLTYALSAQTTIDNGKIHLRFTTKF
jgi:outer membrane protein insertion porin family